MLADEKKQKVYDCFDTYDDFPIPKQNFLDTMRVFHHVDTFKTSIQLIKDEITKKGWKFDYIVAIEARGFLMGVPLALEFGAGFIPIRKKGKLPGKLLTIESSKEYGIDCLEMQESEIMKGAKILIFDDLLATGGTLCAARDIVKKAGAVVIGCACFIELTYLNGKGCLDMDFVAPFNLDKLPPVKPQ